MTRASDELICINATSIGHRTCGCAANRQAPLRACSPGLDRLHVLLCALHTVEMSISSIVRGLAHRYTGVTGAGPEMAAPVLFAPLAPTLGSWYRCSSDFRSRRCDGRCSCLQLSLPGAEQARLNGARQAGDVQRVAPSDQQQQRRHASDKPPPLGCNATPAGKAGSVVESRGRAEGAASTLNVSYHVSYLHSSGLVASRLPQELVYILLLYEI